MTPEQWQKVFQHHETLHGLDAREREQALDLLRRQDAKVCAEVEILLSLGDSDTPLGEPFRVSIENMRDRLDEDWVDQIGQYVNEKLMGKGGMGVVFRAKDPRFPRRLAVKTIRKSAFERSSIAVPHFEEEAELMSMLQHPGVPPIHDRGMMADGRPYYTMKLIEGETLEQLLTQATRFEATAPFCDHAGAPPTCDATPGPSPQLHRFLAIFEQVCQAVAYAHSKNIIHRDLKPANIMVGAHGEVQVMDWGLAKGLGDVSIEQCGNGSNADDGLVGDAPLEPLSSRIFVKGTPGFMAPEQARREVENIDQRSDVFALGGILCAVLTGQPTYTGPNADAILAVASRARLENAYARLAVSGADAELTALCKKCLAPKKEERYRDAGALAKAVNDYQAQVRERLRQAEIARARAVVRRRATIAVAASLILLIAVASVAAIMVRNNDIERERDRRNAVQQLVVAHDAATQTLDALAIELRGNEGVFQLLNRPDRWEGFLTKAEKDLKQAEFLLYRAGGEFGELTDRHQQLRKRLESARKEHALATSLENVRLEKSKLVLRGNTLNFIGSTPAPEKPRIKTGELNYAFAGREYPKTFQTAGLDILQAPLGALAADINRKGVRQQLIAALDDWTMVARMTGQSDVSRRLLNLVAVVDPDTWRNDVRKTVAAQDVKKLEALLDRENLSNQPTHIVVIASAAIRAGGVYKPEPLRFLIARHPQDFWLHFLLGTVSRNADEKIGAYRAALAIRPSAVVARLNLGAVLATEKNDPKAAIEEFEAILAFQKNNAPALYSLGLVYDRLGRVDLAEKYYKNAIKSPPEYSDAHNNLGVLLYRKGDKAGAYAHYLRAVTADAKNASARMSLGAFLAKEKRDYKGAIEQLRKATELAPKDVLTLANLGAVLRMDGRPKDAIKVYQKGLVIAPNDAELHFNLAVALASMANIEGAKQHYLLALQQNDRHARALVNLGNIYYKRGDIKTAVAHYTKALAADPNFGLPHTRLANAHLLQGDFRKAEFHFREALRLPFPDAGPHWGLALSLCRNPDRDINEALVHFETAKKLEQKKTAYLDRIFAAELVNRGKALRKLNQLEGSIVAFQASVKINNKQQAAWFELGSSLWVAGRLDDAAAAYRTVVKLRPDFAPGWSDLGAVLHKQGKYAEATAALQKAIGLDRKYPVPRVNLGIVLRDQGDFRGAIASLRKAIPLIPPNHPMLSGARLILKACEKLEKSEKRLPFVLKGDKTTPFEQLDLADLCRMYLKRYRDAEKLYADAFAADPTLADMVEQLDRYHAARAAVLAATGKGKDAAKLDVNEQVRLRRRALTWLRADLTIWAKQLEIKPQKAPKIQKQMQDWLNNGDLMNVRDAESLTALTKDERKEWEDFWAGVERLRKRALAGSAKRRSMGISKTFGVSHESDRCRSERGS